MMLSRNHNKEKIQLTDQDSSILEFFYLKYWSYRIPVGCEPQIQIGVHSWTPPLPGILKLNFDRAMKGNPRVAGEGGVIRDSGGNIIHLYAGSIGNSKNNATEFRALELDLEIL